MTPPPPPLLCLHHQAPQLSNLCLDGFYHAISLTSMLGMTMLRDTYVTSLSRFTGLHSPSTMTVKSAHALRTLLIAAEHNGNTFQVLAPLPHTFDNT